MTPGADPKASTVTEILARWPSSPAGSCDICNTPIDSQASHRVSAEEFKTVVGQGYNPFEGGRGPIGVAALMGASPAEAYADWQQIVARDATDWGLCETCAKDLASFIAQGPPGPSRPASKRPEDSIEMMRRWGRLEAQRDGKPLHTLTGHKRMVYACAISPDGSYIVSASKDKTCRIWEAATGEERAILTGHTDEVRTCAISPDGSFIVSGGWENTCRIWDAATGEERAILTGHHSFVSDCAISPDGSYIVSASGDKTCRIWDAAARASRDLLLELHHGHWVWSCAISPDGSYVVSASGKICRIWGAAMGAI